MVALGACTQKRKIKQASQIKPGRSGVHALYNHFVVKISKETLVQMNIFLFRLTTFEKAFTNQHLTSYPVIYNQDFLSLPRF